jgi:hypothetical protein
MTNTIPASNAATTASSRPPKSAAVVAHLRDLVKSIPECPSLLQGKVRQTKVRRYCGNRQGASRSAPNASGEAATTASTVVESVLPNADAGNVYSLKLNKRLLQ